MAKKQKISPNYFDGVPRRRENRPWRVKEDGLVEVDMENTGFYHFIARKFFHKPRVSHIALDGYGSVVWQSIDGRNNVMDIVRIMEKEFPGETDRMLDRVVTYLATLQRNDFISMEKVKS